MGFSISRKLIILIAEDDENDTFLLRRAFTKSGVDMPCHICGDGAEAMAYLKGEGKFADRVAYPFPRVLITDIKMPRASGFDLLDWLQKHPECNLIPKIVLSTSASQTDIQRAYQLGANCYFQKPGSMDDLTDLVSTAHNFWLKAELPDLPENC